MAETVEITLYSFAELSHEAQERARDWYREGTLDYDWYDFVYQEFETVCEMIGVTLKTSTVRLMGGGARQRPNIYFRGFSSQGDGACFEGYYGYKRHAAKAVRQYAPKDLALHRIADELAAIQRGNFYQLTAECRHRGHYYHEYCMTVDVDRRYHEMTAGAEEGVREALRDLARWLCARLAADYDYLNSNESIDQMIESNGYRFTGVGAFLHSFSELQSYAARIPIIGQRRHVQTLLPKHHEQYTAIDVGLQLN